MKMSRQISIVCAVAFASVGTQTVWAGQNDYGVTQQTHSAEDDRFDNERFSPADLEFAEAFMIDGYVGTPFGKLLRYNFRTNEVKRIGTVATPVTI